MFTKVKLTEVIASSFYEVHKALKEGKYTHYWLSGGRGSTKSSFISIEIILGIMADPDANAIVLRKVKDTLNDSVKEQLIWAIEQLGVTDYWEIPESKLVLTYLPTGQQIRFRGADKPKKIKSIKFSKGYTKYIWYEELDEFSGMAEIRMINQSLMRGGPTPIVFYSYNPPQSGTNWVNAEKKLTRKDRLVHHSTYLTVPSDWLGPQFIIEAEHLKESNPAAYEHEYMGVETGTGGEVFKNVTIRLITDDEINGNDDLEIPGFDNIKRGLDFGFSIDPASYGVMHLDRKKKKLYIFHEVYEIGLSNTRLIEAIKQENTTNEFVTADSSEPKSINELRQHGLRVYAAKKGPDSIDYGVKYLQDLTEIIIDDVRCPNTAQEFLQYEYEKDLNTGLFKSGYVDKNNHSIDMVRYALNQEIMKHRELKKVKHDPDNLTPQEKHEKKVKAMAGRKAPIKSFMKW